MDELLKLQGKTPQPIAIQEKVSSEAVKDNMDFQEDHGHSRRCWFENIMYWFNRKIHGWTC